MAGLRKRRPGLVYPTYEDWIYVGSGGSAPAFNSGWANYATYPAMAFRRREAGVVDLLGVAATSSTGPSIFTLPEDYRPAYGTISFMPYVRLRSAARSGQLLEITDVGGVQPIDGKTSGDVAFIAGSFFLIPPDTAP